MTEATNIFSDAVKSQLQKLNLASLREAQAFEERVAHPELAYAQAKPYQPAPKQDHGSEFAHIAALLKGENPEAKAKQAEQEELAVHREAALVKIDDEISHTSDPAIKERLTALKARLYSASQVSDILNVLSLANSVTAQGEKGEEHAETLHAKAERQLQEWVAKDQKAQEDLYTEMQKAAKEGKIKDEEEYEHYLALHAQIEQYKKDHPDWEHNKEQMAYVVGLEKQETTAASKATDAPAVQPAIHAVEQSGQELVQQQEKAMVLAQQEAVVQQQKAVVEQQKAVVQQQKAALEQEKVVVEQKSAEVHAVKTSVEEDSAAKFAKWGMSLPSVTEQQTATKLAVADTTVVGSAPIYANTGSKQTSTISHS